MIADGRNRCRPTRNQHASARVEQLQPNFVPPEKRSAPHQLNPQFKGKSVAANASVIATHSTHGSRFTVLNELEQQEPPVALATGDGSTSAEPAATSVGQSVAEEATVPPSGHTRHSQHQPQSHVRVSSPDIALDIRPVPFHQASLGLSAKKRTSQAGKQGEKVLKDIFNLLQVKPTHMKPKEDDPLARNRAQDKEIKFNGENSVDGIPFVNMVSKSTAQPPARRASNYSGLAHNFTYPPYG